MRMSEHKSMLSFMACVVIRDDTPWCEPPTLQEIADDAPAYWPDAIDHLGLIAKSNGCKFGIPRFSTTLDNDGSGHHRKLQPRRTDKVDRPEEGKPEEGKPFCFYCGDSHYFSKDCPALTTCPSTGELIIRKGWE